VDDDNDPLGPRGCAARAQSAISCRLELEDKLIWQNILAVLYVLFGLTLASAPIVYVNIRNSADISAFARSILKPVLLVAGCLIIAGATAILDGTTFLIGAIVLGLVIAALTSADRLRVFTLSFLAIGASGTLLYWKFDDAHSLTIEKEYLAYFFVAIVVMTCLTFIKNCRYRMIDTIFVVGIAIFVVQHSLNTSVLVDNYFYTAVRHHWGAYIGPSETILSGARILYDVPAQYGLGPTLLIAGACGANCWVAMYWIATIAAVIYALIIASAAAVMIRKVDNSWTFGATLLAAALACMVWTSYPPQLAGPWSFPSTGGLRFIPLAALLLFVLWRESRDAGAKPSRLWGHALWCLGAIWSPEAAFYLSLVWWPYLLWRASEASDRPFRAAVLVGVEIVALVALLLIAFVSVYYSIYGLFPSFDVYVAYVVNPTGPQPPNPLGSFWFFAFTLIAGICAAAALTRAEDSGRPFASVFVCLLALFGVFSYYIGRSHDNNILNLMPFLVLALVSVQAFAPFPALSRSARVALASTLASIMFFGCSAWRQSSLSDYADATGVASMSYLRGASPEQSGAAAISIVGANLSNQQADDSAEKSRLDGGSPADAARAVFYVSSVRHEPLIKIDDGLDTAPIGPRAWSAIHDPIDFYFLPDALVAKLIDRTMRRIRSPGWLVIAKHVDSVPETLRWQRLLEGSYVKTEEMDFGAYHAIRFEPNLR
jgi:hypothetical protein